MLPCTLITRVISPLRLRQLTQKPDATQNHQCVGNHSLSVGNGNTSTRLIDASRDRNRRDQWPGLVHLLINHVTVCYK